MIAIIDGLMLRACRSTSRPSRSGIRASDDDQVERTLVEQVDGAAAVLRRPRPRALPASAGSRASRASIARRRRRECAPTRWRWRRVRESTMPAIRRSSAAVGERPLVRGLRRAHGQRHFRRCVPLPCCDVDANLAAVVARDPVDDRQAEARARWRSRRGTAGRCRPTSSGAIPTPSSSTPSDHFGAARRAPALRLRPEPELPAARHRAQAVGRQVPHDLPDLRFVGAVDDRLVRHGHDDRVRLGHLGVVRRAGARCRSGSAGRRDPRPPPAAAWRTTGSCGWCSFRRSDSAQHDVHQLRLVRGQRQLVAQDLDRSRHRRERDCGFRGRCRRPSRPPRPAAAAARASRSRFFSSVTSWKVKRKPARRAA